MTIINIIDNFSKVNYGIWNAAIATAPYLLKSHGIQSALWYPQIEDTPDLPAIKKRGFKKLTKQSLFDALKEENYLPSNTIVVSHGCWQFPTKWGAAMQKKGYKWIYVPHGMLEPWSMEQKKWKKKIYYKLFEGPLSRKAICVRAVGKPEQINLLKNYSNVWLNQNGIDPAPQINNKWDNPVSINYLFMARLHTKKGILPLVEAWFQSQQFNHSKCHLYIAGPDDGELAALNIALARFPNINITYLGAVYGEAKTKLLNSCHVYILPSQSEGFPTSVLEAMNYQMVTVITDGCNFPEAINADKVIRTTVAQQEISNTLKKLHRQPIELLKQKAIEASSWIVENYSNETIANQQAEKYHSILNNTKTGTTL